MRGPCVAGDAGPAWANRGPGSWLGPHISLSVERARPLLNLSIKLSSLDTRHHFIHSSMRTLFVLIRYFLLVNSYQVFLEIIAYNLKKNNM